MSFGPSIFNMEFKGKKKKYYSNRTISTNKNITNAYKIKKYIPRNLIIGNPDEMKTLELQRQILLKNMETAIKNNDTKYRNTILRNLGRIEGEIAEKNMKVPKNLLKEFEKNREAEIMQISKNYDEQTGITKKKSKEYKKTWEYPDWEKTHFETQERFNFNKEAYYKHMNENKEKIIESNAQADYEINTPLYQQIHDSKIGTLGEETDIKREHAETLGRIITESQKKSHKTKIKNLKEETKIKEEATKRIGKRVKKNIEASMKIKNKKEKELLKTKRKNIKTNAEEILKNTKATIAEKIRAEQTLKDIRMQERQEAMDISLKRKIAESEIDRKNKLQKEIDESEKDINIKLWRARQESKIYNLFEKKSKGEKLNEKETEKIETFNKYKKAYEEEGFSPKIAELKALEKYNKEKSLKEKIKGTIKYKPIELKKWTGQKLKDLKLI